MQSRTQSAHDSLSDAAGTEPSARTREELTYQAVTVAAILLVLGSLWVF